MGKIFRDEYCGSTSFVADPIDAHPDPYPDPTFTHVKNLRTNFTYFRSSASLHCFIILICTIGVTSFNTVFRKYSILKFSVKNYSS